MRQEDKSEQQNIADLKHFFFKKVQPGAHDELLKLGG